MFNYYRYGATQLPAISSKDRERLDSLGISFFDVGRTKYNSLLLSPQPQLFEESLEFSRVLVKQCKRLEEVCGINNRKPIEKERLAGVIKQTQTGVCLSGFNIPLDFFEKVINKSNEWWNSITLFEDFRNSIRSLAFYDILYWLFSCYRLDADTIKETARIHGDQSHEYPYSAAIKNHVYRFNLKEVLDMSYTTALKKYTRIINEALKPSDKQLEALQFDKVTDDGHVYNVTITDEVDPEKVLYLNSTMSRYQGITEFFTTVDRSKNVVLLQIEVESMNFPKQILGYISLTPFLETKDKVFVNSKISSELTRSIGGKLGAYRRQGLTALSELSDFIQ